MLVVDASAFLAVLFQEEREEQVRALLTGKEWHAPSILQYEVTNIIATRVRREPQLRDELMEQWDAFSRLPIEYHDINPTAVLHLALDTGLTTYDAAYLWLAESLEYELATLDHQLEAVATNRR